MMDRGNKQKCNWAEKIHPWMIYAYLLVMPLSVFWSLGKPLYPGVYPMYGTAGIYLTDLAMVGVIVTGLLTKLVHQQYKFFHWRGRPFRLLFPVLLIPVWGLFSIPWAISPLLASYTALRWTLAFFLFLTLKNSHVPLTKMVKVFLTGTFLCQSEYINSGRQPAS